MTWVLRLKRLQAGAYETVDGRYRIINEKKGGPGEESYPSWEIARPDTYGGWVVGDWPASLTLREARECLVWILRQGGSA